MNARTHNSKPPWQACRGGRLEAGRAGMGQDPARHASHTHTHTQPTWLRAMAACRQRKALSHSLAMPWARCTEQHSGKRSGRSEGGAGVGVGGVLAWQQSSWVLAMGCCPRACIDYGKRATAHFFARPPAGRTGPGSAGSCTGLRCSGCAARRPRPPASTAPPAAAPPRLHRLRHTAGRERSAAPANCLASEQAGHGRAQQAQRAPT